MNIIAKYVKDLNVNSKMIKPDENRGKSLFNFG